MGQLSNECRPQPKLVVADDDPAIRRLIGSILKREGYEVCLAADGAEAIAMTHEALPDLVILDYMMPDLDGARVAAVLKAADLTCDIPILLLSAMDEAFVEGETPWDYRAEKPFTPSQLKARIAEILDTVPKRVHEESRVESREEAVNVSDIARPMRDGYAEALRNTVAEMEVELDRAVEKRARTAVLESVRRRFHQIRGSAATFGFPGIGDVAAEAETLVREWLGGIDDNTELDLEHIRSALARISDLLTRCDTPHSVVLENDNQRACRRGKSEEQRGRGRVLLLHSDDSYTASVVEAAATLGYEVESHSSPAVIVERLRAGDYEIVTIGGEPAQQEDCDWVGAIQRESGNAAIVLVGGKGATEHRVTAARAGVDRYLSGTPSPAHLASEWEDLSAAATARVGRVMVVDDDPTVLEFVEANLRELGCEVICLSDAVEVFETLEAARPDLLLLDVDMPAANGLEVTRAIRASERWHALPIVIQTAHTSPEYRLKAFESGADDFITKPILEEELSARVLGRLERERAKQDLTQRDPVTGLLSAPAFREAVTTMLSRGDVVIATMELQGFERLVSRHGVNAADTALDAVAQTVRAGFRSSRDIVARVAPHILAVAVSGATTDEVAVRVDGALHQLEQDERLSPSGIGADAIALEASVVGAGAGDTVARALDRSLGRGRPAQRCRLRVEQRDTAVCSSQVYVVEDDPSLREMLVFALQSAGYEVTAFGSGHDALGMLSRLEVPAGVKPLLLLDVEIPGVDGFEILEELVAKRPGVFRVVMLTANDGARERMRAVRAGADDFIAKPLRIADLVNKLGQVSRQSEAVA